MADELEIADRVLRELLVVCELSRRGGAWDDERDRVFAAFRMARRAGLCDAPDGALLGDRLQSRLGELAAGMADAAFDELPAAERAAVGEIAGCWKEWKYALDEYCAGPAIRCPGCQTLINADDVICRGCGRCPGCGDKRRRGDPPCACGHPYDAERLAALVKREGARDELGPI